MQEKFDVCIISVSKEIIIGIYKNNKLIKSIKNTGKTSDILPNMIFNILNKYNIENIFYANGPGNFSAIKLTHIFLKTLSITLPIKIYCADSFYFTKDKYINAYGKIHFMKNKNEISTIILEETYNTIFHLPQEINIASFNTDCMPLYVLPAL